MKLYRCPESFFGAEQPRIAVVNATLMDVADVEKYVAECPYDGSILLHCVEELSPGDIEWKYLALKEAKLAAVVLSDSHVSILEAGMFLHHPGIALLGDITPALRTFFVNSGDIVPEERKNVGPFLREAEDILFTEKN